jgi:chemotaxis methyl-accepting protein methylase
MLIYYADDAKELLFKKFYKTLNDGGFLVLGMAEDVPLSMKKFFKTVDLGMKIYQKISLNP